MVSISMDSFVERFQPERFEQWKIGGDRGPHPEDDQSKLYPYHKRKQAKPKVGITALPVTDVAVPEQTTK